MALKPLSQAPFHRTRKHGSDSPEFTLHLVSFAIIVTLCNGRWSLSSPLSQSPDGELVWKAINVVSGPSSNAGPILPQEPFLEDEGQQVNHWLLGTPLHALDPPVTEEVGLVLNCEPRPLYHPTNNYIQSYPAGLHPSIRSVLIRGNGVVRPSDSMCWASVFPWFTEV